MACDPFLCENCGKTHDRCNRDVVECPACGWSGGNVRWGDPCVKCGGGPTIVRPCAKYPPRHMPTCTAHGGHTESAMAESARREEEFQIAKLLNVHGKVQPISDPYTFLARIAGEMDMVRDRLAERVEQLPDIEDAGTDKYAAQLRVTFQAYEKFLSNCARIGTDMSRLDLDSHIAKLTAAIDSETASIVENALAGALNAGDLSAEQRELVLRVFGALLREPASKALATVS